MFPRRFTWVLVILALLFVVALWLDVVLDVRGPTEWWWARHTRLVPAWRILLPIVTLGRYAILCTQWLAAVTADVTIPAPGAQESR